MRFRLEKPRTNVAAELVALGVSPGGAGSGFAKEWDRVLGGLIGDILKKEGFKYKPGETKLLTLPGKGNYRYLLLVGLGEGNAGQTDALRQLGGQAVQIGRKVRAGRIAVAVPERGGSPRDALRQITEGVVLGGYSFDFYRSKDQLTRQTVQEVLLLAKMSSRGLDEAIHRGRILGEATNRARDLINMPASDMTPRRMAEEARQIGRLPGLKVQIHDRKWCEKMGMGGFLAVARGSTEPPYLIHLTYQPPRKGRRTVALVGKGITFDSGGLSLKTAQGMETMKYDMSGAAVVLAVMRALAELKPPVAVHGIAAVTENMPSGSAEKPGDVARTLTGKTIEILNTDAEGRLTLADAIPYAIRQKPDCVVDLATLTGACLIALGERYAAIMGNDAKLIRALIQSAQVAGERIWELPMVEEYREELKSAVADVKNIGGKWGGTITAGLFLQEFVTPKVPWAHIDMAGPSWSEKDQPLGPKGSTGAMVRTLCHFLLEQGGA